MMVQMVENAGRWGEIVWNPAVLKHFLLGFSCLEALREPLVDLLVPQVTSALTSSLAALDRDITSKALEGRPGPQRLPKRPKRPENVTETRFHHFSSFFHPKLTVSAAFRPRDDLKQGPDDLFVPLQPPSTIFCEGVVTLWRFIHDALDAPLSAAPSRF